MARAETWTHERTDAHTVSGTGSRTGTRTKRALLWVAGVRVAVGAVALPLAPFLYRHHFLVLVLLRPSQGVLLAGAVLARHGGIPLWELIVAAVPLQVGAGYGLGVAQHRAGVWVVIVGIAGLVVLAGSLTWLLWRRSAG